MSRCATEILANSNGDTSHCKKNALLSKFEVGSYNIVFNIILCNRKLIGFFVFYILYYLKHDDLSTVLVSKSNCINGVLRKIYKNAMVLNKKHTNVMEMRRRSVR